MGRKSEWGILAEEGSSLYQEGYWLWGQSTQRLLRFSIYKISPYHQQRNLLSVQIHPLHLCLLHFQNNQKEVGRINFRDAQNIWTTVTTEAPSSATLGRWAKCASHPARSAPGVRGQQPNGRSSGCEEKESPCSQQGRPHSHAWAALGWAASGGRAQQGGIAALLEGRLYPENPAGLHCLP